MGTIAAISALLFALSFLLTGSVPILILLVLLAAVAVFMGTFFLYMAHARKLLSYEGGGVQGKILDNMLRYLDWDGNGTLLDIGCGSGILGIAAMVLGCAMVVGCDIDPNAPDIALKNAGLNGITDMTFKIYAGDILKNAALRETFGSGYDIVLANIVADVIIPLAPIAREFLAPHGVFICSGILDGRQDEVAEALADAAFAITEHRHEDGWHCFSAVPH